MPTWLSYMIFWIPVQLFLSDLPMTAIIGNLLCIQGFVTLDNSVNWYIGALWFFYFLSPYLHGICKRNTSKGDVLMMCFLWMCSVPFWGYDGQLIGVSRLPVFYLGMILAKHKEGILDGRKQMAIFGAAILGILTVAICG